MTKALLHPIILPSDLISFILSLCPCISLISRINENLKRAFKETKYVNNEFPTSKMNQMNITSSNIIHKNRATVNERTNNLNQ